MTALIIAVTILGSVFVGMMHLARLSGLGRNSSRQTQKKSRLGQRPLVIILSLVVLTVCLSLLGSQSDTLAAAGIPTFNFNSLSQAGPPQSPAYVSAPTVSLDVPAQVFIGDSFSFVATFDNTGADPGYGPFIDLVFPVNGVDGVAGAGTDGIDFVDATYLGAALTSVELTFPDDGGGVGCVDHPYAVDTSHVPYEVCSTTGDKLVVLQLPFGSFTGNQPPAAVTVNATMSNLADLGVSLPIYARGGFRFGEDPLDNPCCDSTVVNPVDPDPTTWPASGSVEPYLLSATKTYNGPEDETATGPNFPRQYTIDVEIAPGQVVNNLVITDSLPNNMAFLNVVSILPAGGTVTLTPPVGVAANPPNNILQVEYPSVTGGSAIRVVFEYFIPQVDAGSAPVIDPDSGNDVPSENKIITAGNWDPIDTRDPDTPTSAGGICPLCPPGHTLTDKAIAIQKGIGLAVDNPASGYSPGDVVEFTLNFQISDFFSFGNVVITDIFSDGMRFDPSFVPTLSFSDQNDTIVGGTFISGTNFFVDTSQIGNDPNPATDGSTTLTFDVSAAIDDLGGADGNIEGGYTTGVAGPAVGTVTFHTIIQEEFSDDYPSGDQSVDHGDVMNNNVTITGDVLANGTLVATGQNESDTSGASLTIINGSLEKRVYAVNGSTTFSTPVQVSPGYSVTYRLTYDLPTSNFEDLSFTDYLPLPIFSATTITAFDPTVSAAAPPVGQAKFGPAETFYNSNIPSSQIVPTITTNAAANSVTFDYGDYDDPTDADSTVDILFTVEVSDEPFADELFLTNMARAYEGSTNAGSGTADDIIQIEIFEPVLVLSKGILGSDNSNAVSTPPITAPASFPTIDSSDLAANPVDSNISNVDAGDLINFAVVVENQGHSGGFDLIVRDIIVPGFVIPPGGINLQVARGDGLVLGYNIVPGGTYGDDRDFLVTGIEILEPTPTEPVCQPYTAPPGTNIVVITYDLMVDPAIEPPDVVPNTATLENYAGTDGGPNHVDDPLQTPDYNDQATTTVAYPVINKTFINTNQAHTTGTNITVGEIFTYTVTVDIPEGVSPDAYMDDWMDWGLAFVDMVAITNSNPASLTITNWPPITTTRNSGRGLTIDFGTITNTNRANPEPETITMTYRVVALNNNGINAGYNRNNRARWYWGSEGEYVEDWAPNARVYEPQLQIVKTVNPIEGDAADVITFTLTITNGGSGVNYVSDAFEVELSDVIPTGMTYVPGSLAHTAGIAPATLDDSGDPLLVAAWDTITANESSQLQFRVTLDNANLPNTIITNTANISWTGLPGDVTTPQSPYNNTSTERTGDTSNPGGTQNDYRNNGEAGVTINVPGITKALVGTDQAFTTGSNVTIGEIVTYSMVITLPEGNTPAFTVTDNLPAGLAYVAGSGQVDATGFDGTLTPLSITSGGLSGDPVIFTFDPAIVNADNDPTDNSFEISLQAQVLDEAGNVGLPPGQTILVNNATLRFASGSEGTSNDVLTPVVEPHMVLTKTFDPSQAIAGDVVTITLAATNSGTSAAFDVIVEDPLPNNLFPTITETTTPGGFVFSTGSTITETTVRYTGGDIAVGSTVYFTFTAQLTDNLVGGIFTNTAVVTQATTLPGPNPDERNEPQEEGEDTLELLAVAIGNIVWIDDGAGGGTANNGILDGTEAPAAGVEMQLFNSGDNPLTDTPVATTTTNGNGRYYFDNLVPGTYFVHIPGSEFGASQPLEGYVSTTGAGAGETSDHNADENGIDEADLATNGISSRDYDLQPHTEVTGEDATDYPGSLYDDNANFTADFGFVELVAIGNIVWIDDGAGGGTANNGILDGTETPVAGVEMQLFNSGDDPLTEAPVLTTTTNSNGRYYFDNLVPGTYFVHIPGSEFVTGQPLVGYISTTGAGADETSDHNADENGIDNNNPAANGISSQDYTLAANTEATGEDATDYPGYLDDDNTNFTDDFGFIPAVALGNIVWIDDGAGGGTANNGILDGTEAPVAGVEMQLLNSGDNPLTDTPVLTTTTNSNGRYYFDNLAPGAYFVHIPASEFAAGQPLDGYASTTGAGANETSDHNADENGIDNNNPAANGISSPDYTLAPNTEVTGEDATDYPGYLDDDNTNFTADFGFHNDKVAIGNIVWIDDGAGGGTANNGILDGSEAGVDGVTVQLFNQGDNPSTDTPVASTTTSGGGYYEFDNLNPGQYFVHIPESEFGVGQTLQGYISSQGAGSDEVTNENGDENGIDNPAPVSGGVSSQVYDLQPDSEITGEDETSYSGSLDDNNVNFTADFGFVQAVALGNIVWFDDGAGGGVTNNGIMDGAEVGVANVIVELYAQGSVPGTDTPVLTTTTDINGVYIFDNLYPGQYFVHIPASEFGASQPLEGYASSTGAGADEVSDEIGDENGIDDITPTTNGISSQVYDLQPDSEVTGEDQSAYTGTLDDDNVNFTADFGFHNDKVAIGNIVWIDDGSGGGTPDNGIMDGTEAGVANVDVELYAQGDTPGTDTPVLTTTTNANGYYQFDNLAPGSYFVHIPVSEFGSGQNLENYFSTTGAGSDETTDQNGDENGVDVNPEINGISSQDYNLQPDTEATGEDQSSYTGTLDDDNVNFTADFGFVRPAIQVEKSVDIAWVAPNQIVTYTIDITNTGDVTLNPVVVTDTMDPGLTYQSGTANPAGVVSNGQELVWADVTSGAGLAPGASIQITFLASVPTITGTYQNFVLVEGIHPTGSVTDTDDVPLHVEDPSVAIDKGVVPPGVVDGLITFTIRITNTGPSTLDQVPMFDNFTGPVEYYSAYPEPNTVDPVNNTLAWNDLTGSAPNGFDQNLNPGEAFVITTVFRLTTTDQQFSMANEATVTSDTGNPATDVLTNEANQPSDRVELVNEPTAITLLYFAGDRVGDNVVLNWATAVEINNFGFKLMRSTAGNLTDAVEIAFVNGQGSGTASGASYSYTDNDVAADQTYTYWLVDVDNDGSHTIHDPVTVEPTTLDGGGDVMIFLPLIFK